MDVEIKVINKFSEEVLKFLVNESYILFCEVKGVSSLSDDKNKILQDNLKKLYVDNNNDKDKIYVAYKFGVIVGCAYLNEHGYLSDLFVKKEEQKQGVGSLILKKIIEDIKENENIVLHAHPLVVAFYKRFGFDIVEESTNSIKMKR